MKVGMDFLCGVLVAMVVCDVTLAYPYSRYGRRNSRPRSRLFGSPYSISRGARSRFETDGTQRPLSRPFEIPGFTQHSGRQSDLNMGFDLGFGNALMDPMAGFNDPLMGVGDMGMMSGFGDMGFGQAAAQSRSPISRTAADLQLDQSLFGGQNLNMEFVDSSMGQFLPAAGSRSMSSMDMNSALSQPMDISFSSPLNDNMQMGGSQTQTSFSTAQLGDGLSSIQIIGENGLSSGGMSQMGLSNQGLNSLGLATGNQINLGSGPVQLESNQLGMGNVQYQTTGGANIGMNADNLGISSDNLGISSDNLAINVNSLGMNTDGLGLNMNQLGVGANQVMNAGQSLIQLDSDKFQGNQIGINSLGNLGLSSNQVLLDGGKIQMTTSNGDFNGGQLTLNGNQQLLTAGQMSQMGMGNGQLDVDVNGQGTLGLPQPTGATLGNTQFLTSSGGLGNTIITTAQDGNAAAANQFFTQNGNGETRIISQSQGGNGMTSQLDSALLSELNQGQITIGT